MAINDDIKITINLNELVEIRAKLLTQYEDYSKAVSTGEYLDENDIDKIATQLRETLTWDTLYFMVDTAIYDYMGLQHPDKPHYGEIQPEPGREEYLNQIEKNKKQFEMVDLVSPAWTIQVPRRKK
jgi:hypothetical protein